MTPNTTFDLAPIQSAYLARGFIPFFLLIFRTQ
jgi:hypothetical protein